MTFESEFLTAISTATGRGSRPPSTLAESTHAKASAIRVYVDGREP